ncbi:probable adenylate kinase 7, mitochondrial isoform X1 [Typha latifolia]|uniref:probable adenylate kinase 7, mitochondrial isoform X1 n=1 Tax=Typha latifolia TaxID=4733 RepID=UPI003C2F8B16
MAGILRSSAASLCRRRLGKRGGVLDRYGRRRRRGDVRRRQREWRSWVGGRWERCSGCSSEHRNEEARVSLFTTRLALSPLFFFHWNSLVPYISMGTLVRQELRPHSSLYNKIANAVKRKGILFQRISFLACCRNDWRRDTTGVKMDSFLLGSHELESKLEDSLVTKQFGNDVHSHCGEPFDARNSESISLNPCLATCTQHA